LKQTYLPIKDRLELSCQDVATSNDPLIVALERCGYNQKRIKALQDSISAKLTIDMFTGKVQELSQAEKMFQMDVTKSLKQISGR
jgi:hypothetical protein